MFSPRHLATALAAVALLIFASLATLHDDERYFPLLVIRVLDGASANSPQLKTTMLMEGVPSRRQCESTLSSITSSVQGSCRQCGVVTSECVDVLTDEQVALLSAAPLDLFTARLPSGIAAYQSDSVELARQACEETERRAAGTGGTVKCHPPGSARPTALDSSGKSARAWNSGDVWNILAWIAFAVLAIQLARPLTPFLGARAVDLPRWQKQAVIAASDVVALEACLWAAFSIRLETFSLPSASVLPIFALSPLIAVPIFIRTGLYRAVMRYLGLRALGAIAKAVLLYTAVLTLAVFVLSLPNVPRSIPLIHGALAMLLIGGTRALARHWLVASGVGDRAVVERKRVLIYGAGSAGIQLASALAHSREVVPIALVDDDPILHRKQIAGLNVSSPNDLPDLIRDQRIAEVLLAIPSASRKRRHQIIEQLEPLPVHVRTLPGVAELAEGKVKTSSLREIDIEDLLGRDPVAPDQSLLSANVAGKAVMVTGAGGSIGSELCRQIAARGPRCLLLFEVSEFALYSIEHDLLSSGLMNGSKLFPILGTVCDPEKLKRVLSHFGVQTIFHAAAYKHVPMVEKNPCEGAINNVLGTWHTANAALEVGVESFVLISTDKAVRPTNTMGTTKRLAEMVLQALSAEFPKLTRFAMVRFGNVLGSSGSVVPLFREQIRQGGPVTVTDPRIVRYFMTIPEAAQLVIQAGAMGSGGDVFVLDMGEPVKILELARRMINLSGLSVWQPDTSDGDIKIEFTGLRPGEKLYEELLIGEHVSPTSHPRIRKANETALPLSEIRQILADLSSACAMGDSDQLRIILRQAVREFVPQCENMDPMSERSH